MAAIPQPVNNATMRLEGRDYCAFGLQNGISCVPVDAVRSFSGRVLCMSDPKQLEDMLFNNFHTVLTANEILQTVPPSFSTDKDIRAIDCGYGTGIWGDDVLGYRPDNYVSEQFWPRACPTLCVGAYADTEDVPGPQTSDLC